LDGPVRRGPDHDPITPSSVLAVVSLTVGLATGVEGVRANGLLLAPLLAATAVVYFLALDYSLPRTVGPNLDRLVAWRRARGGIRPENWSEHLT
jgi:hypothetical protein